MLFIEEAKRHKKWLIKVFFLLSPFSTCLYHHDRRNFIFVVTESTMLFTPPSAASWMPSHIGFYSQPRNCFFPLRLYKWYSTCRKRTSWVASREIKLNWVRDIDLIILENDGSRWRRIGERWIMKEATRIEDSIAFISWITFLLCFLFLCCFERKVIDKEKICSQSFKALLT